MESKTCASCKCEKPVSDFYHRAVPREKEYGSFCKICVAEKGRSDKSKLTKKIRYQKNKKKLDIKAKRFRRKHKKRIAEKRKIKYSNNKALYLQKHWRSKKIITKSGEYFTLEDFKREIEKTCGTCAICDTYPNHKKGLVVDHNHATGLFRGILCPFCNSGIGFLKENPELLKKAIKYLTK